MLGKQWNNVEWKTEAYLRLDKAYSTNNRAIAFHENENSVFALLDKKRHFVAILLVFRRSIFKGKNVINPGFYLG